MQRGIPGLMQETRSASQVSRLDALRSYRAAQVISERWGINKVVAVFSCHP
jgi:hypothetical protein